MGRVLEVRDQLLKAEKAATKVWKDCQGKTGGDFFNKSLGSLEQVLQEASMCLEALRVFSKFRKTTAGEPATAEHMAEKVAEGVAMTKTLVEQTTALRPIAPKPS